MKKILLGSFSLFLQVDLIAQCGSPVPGGSATAFLTTFSRGCINPVVADKNLNTIAFVHRTNTLTSGNYGNLVYDISTNGGSSWSTNIGFLNPLSTSYARFPNLTIYNPPLNTTPANAYIGYLASTVNSTTIVYNGVVSGVRQISGTGNTENYNQPIVNPSFISGSLVKGAPGTFWAIDGLYNGTYVTGFTVYKGVWNGSNDIVWTNNLNISPGFNTGYTATGAVPADYNIAFDPTGNIGYISFLGHLSTGPAGYAYYPILYKTTNGGSTWTGPITVDITQFNCLTANVGTGNIPSTNFEHDLTVDINGNPHLITVLLNGNNAYAVYYGLWHHVFDITLKNGLWAAYDLGNVNAGRGTWGTSPNSVSQDIFPRISRTSDGTKIFFTWTDNSNYLAGAANLTPNLFSKAYNVTTDMWTATKDFSSCNLSASGKMIFPHLAPEVLEPGAGAYKLAPVYGEFSTGANDPTFAVNFNFLDNATYASSEFSIATTAALVSIQPGPSLVLCPTSSITLGLSSTQGQFQWSTGATTPTISITSGTATSYSIVAQQGCHVGTASVTVSNMTLNSSVMNPNICPGSSGTFTAMGNALGYTWTPGNVTGTNVAISPTSNIVTLTALGSGSCTSIQTISINLLIQPTLSIAGSNTICSGLVLPLTVSGAQTYTWDNGATGATFTDTPMTNTVYIVIGTAANSCTNMQTMSVTVKPSPTVNVSSTQSAICVGQNVGLMASGASTYSWDAISSSPNITVSPAVTTVYTLTGAASNFCENSKTIAITVYPLPSVTITPTKPLFCKGEKTKLTATGAVSYTWVSPGVLTNSIQVNPIVNTTYTVIASSIEGCVNTKTFELVVSPCTGIDENSGERSTFMIYPNPNNGEFTVKCLEAMDFIVVNELGQVIQTFKSDTSPYEIRVKGFPGGIYFIVGQKGNFRTVQKVIVN